MILLTYRPGQILDKVSEDRAFVKWRLTCADKRLNDYISRKIEDVSDHYPVEVRMRGSVAPRVLANVTSNVGTGVTFLATAEGLANITVSEDAVDWINVRYFVVWEDGL